MTLNKLVSHFSELAAEGLPVEPVVRGRLTRIVGMTMEAVGLNVPIGQRCLVGDIEAEVVGFSDERVFLMPAYAVQNLQPGLPVVPIRYSDSIPVGPGLLGRVLNGAGEPLDGKGKVEASERVDFAAEPLNPLHRDPVRKPLDIGVRAINALFTIGRGQRIGIFSGSGVGKSVLLGMMTRFTEADITVVCLVGERGREVKEFIEDILGEEGMARAVVVASPADDAPLMRLRAAMVASRIAEYFRDQGKQVLLLMDSLTRFAQAQREIALAIGEPPATKGYPPSVFARLPQLVERAGNGRDGRGAITAFYTVLAEGDDVQDPVADAARAILDGHILLSRTLADEGHYPAIDVEASISRVMPVVIDKPHMAAATRFRQIYSRFQQSRDLINVGAYVPGSDPDTDLAINKMPLFREFLQQGLDESVNLQMSEAHLQHVLAVPEQQDLDAMEQQSANPHAEAVTGAGS
jgi:flagellum-specific ATP synthase